MRGMILAAGRGNRMGALTGLTPKPLLQLRGRYLIEYSIEALVAAGVREIVINISYRREQIKNALGDGSRYGVAIEYSEEEHALETGGGILQALPLLGEGPFIVLSADVVSSFPLKKLPQQLENLAHLVLVDNPSFHPRGDYCLEAGRIFCGEGQRYTYANIGVYCAALFQGCQPGRFRLATVLEGAIDGGRVSGEYFRGGWCNIGTEEELRKAEGLVVGFPN